MGAASTDQTGLCVCEEEEGEGGQRQQEPEAGGGVAEAWVRRN